MDMFEEITKEKKELPRLNTISKKVVKYKYNAYQILAIILFCGCFVLGIIFGNLFPACGSTSFYSEVCMTTEFNLALMTFVWIIGLLVSTFFFALGQIITLLEVISRKLK